mmetsp:Transcript_7259/g.21042  ORF Transcript_7259/g.21042 Transcript_7259/m.21042 type:complete len:199 (-) Transcript_7259:87-683(-)
MMEVFFDAFYNRYKSYASAEDDYTYLEEKPLLAEIELIKVTAPRLDLNRFSEELHRIKHNVGIPVEISVVIPSTRHEDMLELAPEDRDFLDMLFSDTIPLLHDVLTYGSPEAEFFQIKGPKGSLDLFNDMVATMIYGKELQCKLEVTDRRKLYGPKYLRKTVKNGILGSATDESDLLDTMFSADFSKTAPALHSLLVA